MMNWNERESYQRCAVLVIVCMLVLLGLLAKLAFGQVIISTPEGIIQGSQLAPGLTFYSGPNHTGLATEIIPGLTQYSIIDNRTFEMTAGSISDTRSRPLLPTPSSQSYPYPWESHGQEAHPQRR